MYQGSRALPSSKKTHSERHKQILKQLLKESDNRTCVDCKTATHPRWASWNLGCFMCIRCSGIHRSMGVHISKVKSVDLDAWTDEQVELMVKWGNEKCNSYWESKLPPGYVPDQLKIENFIRTKYDLKKWTESSTIPDPMTMTKTSASTSISNPEISNGAGSGTGSGAGSGTGDLLNGLSSPSTSNSRSMQTKSTPALSDNLLDDDFGSFTSASNSPTTRSASTSSSKPQQKTTPGSTAGVNSNIPRGNTTNIPMQSSSNFSLSSPQGTGGSMSNGGRPDLKKSILSLYSSPSSSSSSFMNQPQINQPQYSQTPQITRPQTNYDANALSNSLQGLNFNTNSSATMLNSTIGPSHTPTSTSTSSSTKNPHMVPNPNSGSSQSSLNQPSSQPSSQPSWNNEWSDLTSLRTNVGTTLTTVNTAGLDDDLFKNVWK